VKVKEITASPAVAVAEGTPVAQSAAVLRDRRISAVPVLDAADAGMRLVSEYDLLARPGHTAAEAMTRALVSVTEHTDVKEVRRPLVQRRNRRVPVLARSALVGIASRSDDVVALLTSEWTCGVCGETARREHPRARCPKSHAATEDFTAEAPPGD
jgi:CBS-domain-containing membrane protein